MADVKYTITLEDLVSAKIEKATDDVSKFEGALGGVKESLVDLGTKGAASIADGLGIPYSADKLVDFVKDGIDMVNKLGQAEAQVKSALASTNNAAGLSYEELENSAKKFSDKLPYTQTQIAQLQSQLLSYPGITKTTFDSASQAVMNISSRQNKGLDDTANLVGRALKAPEKGMEALKGLGVELSQTQVDAISKLTTAGHTVEAQSIILKELQTRFGGAAQAAADADPLYKYKNVMDSIKESVGEAGVSLIRGLAPALEWTIGVIKKGIDKVKAFSDYLKENMNPILREIKQDVIALGIGVGVAAAGFLIAVPGLASYTAGLVLNGIETAALTAYHYALTGAQWAAAAGQWAINTAMEANPVGLVVIGVAALVAVLVLAYEKSDKFRAVLSGIGEAAKSVGGIFVGLGEAIMGAINFNPELIAKGVAKIGESYKDVGNAFNRGYNTSMAESKKKHAEEKKEDEAAKKETTLGAAIGKPKEQNGPPIVPTPTGDKSQSTIGKVATDTTGKPIPTPPAKTAPSATSKVSGGTKATTINIHIGSLIKSFSISTTNMEESASKVQEMVTRVLLSAVNDSQLVVGQ